MALGGSGGGTGGSRTGKPTGAHSRQASKTRAALSGGAQYEPAWNNPAADIVHALELRGAPPGLRPIFIALDALAIALLAAASLPQQLLPAGPFASAVTRRRPLLAQAGIALLLVATVGALLV